VALDAPDVFTLDAAPREQTVLDLQHDFSPDRTYVPSAKRVVCFNDAPEDTVFLGYNPSMRGLGRDGVEDIWDSLVFLPTFVFVH